MVLDRNGPLFIRMTQGAGNCLDSVALTSAAEYMLKQTFVSNSLINIS